MLRFFLLAGLLVLVAPGCRSLDRFEVEAPVAGIGPLAAGAGVDLLVVHGMGGFPFGNPDTILAAIRERNDWQEPETWRDEHLEEGARVYGRVRRHTYADAGGRERGRAVVYYWTSVTAGPKELYLGYDRGGAAERRREDLNHALKRDFVVKNVPDLALYLGRHRAAIHRGLRRAFEILAEGPSDRPVAIITYSLGARIVIDLLADLAASERTEDQELARVVFDRLRFVGLLSNQLALLELLDFDYDRSLADGGDPPLVDEESPGLSRVLSPSLSRFDAELRRREVAEGRDPLTVLAVSDPNDLLSFGIPEWMREALPGRFVNAYLSVAQTSYCIPFVGSIARPDRAHREYAHTPAVLDLLMEGAELNPRPESPRESRGTEARREEP